MPKWIEHAVYAEKVRMDQDATVLGLKGYQTKKEVTGSYPNRQFRLFKRKKRKLRARKT